MVPIPRPRIWATFSGLKVQVLFGNRSKQPSRRARIGLGNRSQVAGCVGHVMKAPPAATVPASELVCIERVAAVVVISVCTRPLSQWLRPRRPTFETESIRLGHRSSVAFRHGHACFGRMLRFPVRLGRVSPVAAAHLQSHSRASPIPKPGSLSTRSNLHKLAGHV